MKFRKLGYSNLEVSAITFGAWATEEKNATLGQLVLRWTVEQPGITSALAGARNSKQALENAAAMDIALSPQEINLIT